MAWSSVFSLALVVLTTSLATAQEDKAPGPPPKPAEGKTAAAAKADADPEADVEAKAPPDKPPAEDRPAPVGLLKLSDELRSSTLTGKFKEIDVAARNAKIATSGVGSLVETPVRQPTRAALGRQGQLGQLDRRLLGTEVRRWLPDLEACRTNVARAAGVTPAEVSAGTVGLRWTVLPSGGARGALVLEEAATDLELMKCARKRMSAWRFTPPTEGPVDVAYSYTFAALPPPPPRPAVAADDQDQDQDKDKDKDQSAAAKAPAPEKNADGEARPATEDKPDKPDKADRTDRPAPEDKAPESRSEETAPPP
jgi:hypothetical protein